MIRTDPFGPIHPAEHFREDFLEPLGMSAGDAATALKLSLGDLQPFLDERAPLTAALALRLERAFGSSAEYWMRWQSRYELDVAKRAGIPELSLVPGLPTAA